LNWLGNSIRDTFAGNPGAVSSKSDMLFDYLATAISNMSAENGTSLLNSANQNRGALQNQLSKPAASMVFRAFRGAMIDNPPVLEFQVYF